MCHPMSRYPAMEAAPLHRCAWTALSRVVIASRCGLEQTQSPSVRALAAAAGLHAAERSEAATGAVTTVETRTMAAHGRHRQPVKPIARRMAE